MSSIDLVIDKKNRSAHILIKAKKYNLNMSDIFNLIKHHQYTINCLIWYLKMKGNSLLHVEIKKAKRENHNMDKIHYFNQINITKSNVLYLMNI